MSNLEWLVSASTQSIHSEKSWGEIFFPYVENQYENMNNDEMRKLIVFHCMRRFASTITESGVPDVDEVLDAGDERSIRRRILNYINRIVRSLAS